MRYVLLALLSTVLMACCPNASAATETTPTVTETVVDAAKEPLKQALVVILDSVIAAKDFLLTEIPDVIQQLLIWNFAYHLIRMLASILIFFGLVWIFSRLYKTANWNSSDVNLREVLAMVSGISCIPAGIAAIVNLNLEWLQIWVAPKVWLIEYAAQLVK